MARRGRTTLCCPCSENSMEFGALAGIIDDYSFHSNSGVRCGSAFVGSPGRLSRTFVAAVHVEAARATSARWRSTGLRRVATLSSVTLTSSKRGRDAVDVGIGP